jgi:hypothetical protein
MTLTTITYLAGNTENAIRLIRPSSKLPTDRGAARMVAAYINERNDGDYPMVKPSDISICRVEMAVFAR